MVTVNWQQNGPNTLLDDISHEKIVVHRIKSGYLHNLKYKNIKYFILKAIRHVFFKLLDGIFYWDDEAQHWGRHLIPCVENIIEQYNIHTIVATGHPFQSNYWASEIKKRNPSIKLIQDFRDPWIQHAHKNLRSRRNRILKNRVIQSLELADLIVTVTDELMEEYKKYSPSGNYIVIPNGFDPDVIKDIVKNNISKDNEAGCITMTHIGNITNNRDKVCDVFLQAIRSLSTVYAFQIHFAGHIPGYLLKKYSDLIASGALIYHGYLSQIKALSLVAQSDFAIQFNAEIVPYLVSTKIYEYAALKIPTISLNFGGSIDKLINDSSLGYSINVGNANVEADIKRIISDEKSFDFNVENYTYKHLAKQYSDFL